MIAGLTDSRRLALGASCLVLIVSGCGSSDDEPATPTTQAPAVATDLPQGSEPVDLDPARFTNEIDNPYWPMKPGSRWVYRGSEGSEEVRIEVSVTNEKKVVEGIAALVLLDEVTHANGDLIERTYDWYAQDAQGNVWYLGEDTKEYEDGKVVSTSGSWESGVDGAEAGVIMPGRPRVGLSYRQEYYEGEAEDRARVISLSASAKVPFGSFDKALETEDTTPLEPNLIEHKYYARGIGPVLKTAASGGGREELVSFSAGRS
jgi:hypothetical protein